MSGRSIPLQTTALVATVALLLCMTAATGQTLDVDALRSTLQSPQRPIADRMRDEDRRPAEVLHFLQLERGMTVLDVYAAGGYFTWVLSHATGPDGLVLAQNSPRALRYGEDRSDITQGDALARKLASGVLPNVQRIDRPIMDTGLAPASVDFILVSQILHDHYNRSPGRALRLLRELHDLLKPGGIVGIIDHAGLDGLDNRRLHRMPESDARQVADAAGFIVEASSDLLAEPGDNPHRSIFDPMLARQTDQFLLRLRKPR